MAVMEGRMYLNNAILGLEEALKGIMSFYLCRRGFTSLSHTRPRWRLCEVTVLARRSHLPLDLLFLNVEVTNGVQIL